MWKNSVTMLLGCLFLAMQLIKTSAFAADATKPNIINIVVDDMGYSDIGCMGGEIKTPHIDSLAKTGILFTHYRTSPKCFPTCNAMMTGIGGNPRDSITLGEALKPAGYGTYFVGKTHGTILPNFKAVCARGFDRSFGNKDGGNYWDPTLKQCMLDGEAWTTDGPF